MALNRDEVWRLRLRDARADIAARLEQRVYAPSALAHLLSTHRRDWQLPRTLTTEFFCDYLVRTKLLRPSVFVQQDSTAPCAPDSPRSTLYAKPDTTQLELALALRADSFLSHLSAAYVHGLTDIVPRMLQTNKEQTAKPTSNQPRSLTQPAIDRVFAAPARTTSLIYSTKEFAVALLSGQYTGRLEVGELSAPDGRSYPVTSLERTLIDCTVRPGYAGGIHEVLQLYTTGKERISVRRLRKLLDDFAYLYPYRQAIGFLLERTGHPEARLALFEQPRFEYDFYLDYAIPKRAHSSRWRLYYPQGL